MSQLHDGHKDFVPGVDLPQEGQSKVVCHLSKLLTLCSQGEAGVSSLQQLGYLPF